jgi:hypothetical protein
MGILAALAIGASTIGTAVYSSEQQKEMKADADRKMSEQNKLMAQEQAKMKEQQKAVDQQKTSEQIALAQRRSKALIAGSVGGFSNIQMPTKNILGG